MYEPPPRLCATVIVMATRRFFSGGRADLVFVCACAAWLAVLVWAACSRGCGLLRLVTGGTPQRPGNGWFGGLLDSVFGGQVAPPAPAGDPFAYLTTCAAALFGLGALAIVGSFVPGVGVFVPRKAAGVAVVCAVAAGVLKAFLAKFLGPLLWAGFGLLAVGGVFAFWPWFVALKSWSLHRLGTQVAADDPRGGVALLAAAARRTRVNGADKAWRKGQVEKFEQQLKQRKK